MSIEGIPDGWELVRIGEIQHGEFFIHSDGCILQHNEKTNVRMNKNYVIIRKIEKPKKFRPFANAAEFEPYRDRWIQRSSKHDAPDEIPEGCFKVVGYNDHHYWTDGGRCTSYEKAFYDGKCFDDGTPFGIEVTE